jgi:hypothetical protein
MAEREYIRLARPRLRSGFQVAFASRSSLWLGKDHLLCVETNGYTETYKRFYFRDIQAFTLRRTRRRLALFWVFVLPVVLSAIVLIIATSVGLSRHTLSEDFPALCWWGGILVAFTVPLLLNYLRGPTCIVRIHTAVQEEELSALKRVRQVHKIMARIRPLIAEAQGPLAGGDLANNAQERAAESQPGIGVDDPVLPTQVVG